MIATRRPVIGIPCSMYGDAWYTPATGVTVSYVRAVEAAGGVPLLIPLTRNPETIDAHYQRCNGLLLAGGEDVGPERYGHTAHPKLGKPDPLRDELEIELTRRAAADGKPILGICRGIQLLNVALGGTLYQDIPAEYTGALNHEESTQQRNMSHLAHPIAIEPDSWLAGALDTTDSVVNTLHHQALRDVAPLLRVIARAADGLIEGVEGCGPAFMLGVQCHPEELWERVDPRWARVFAGFVAATR